MEQDILKQINTAFAAVSKAEWLEKVSQDLKGKPLSDLAWQLNDTQTFSPIYTKEDIANFDTSVLKNHNPDWQIGEHYEVENYKESNAILLKDLMHGLNAPVFSFVKQASAQDFEQLFKGVGLDHIYLHFNAANSKEFLTYLTEQNIEQTSLNFYFKQDDVHIDARSFYQGEGFAAQEIAQAIASAKQVLESAEDKASVVQHLRFTFYVDNAYLLNIAKLRAFKLSYLDLLKSYGLNAHLPFIYAAFYPEAYGSDVHDNMINATSLAMSAVLGGANHLIVKPTEDTQSAKRLARNVQLILKHESGLHEVADPANGSYYIESLTKALVCFVRD